MTALLLLAAVASAGRNPLALAAIPFGLLASRAWAARVSRPAMTQQAGTETVVATLYLRKGRLRLRRRAP